MRRHASRGWLTADHCRMVLDAVAEFPLARYPHATLLPRVWALRDNLTAYDAAYVALAEMLDAPLVTRDRRLAAASGHEATIELM
jgi:predicted nucleic acid-binding protein